MHHICSLQKLMQLVNASSALLFIDAGGRSTTNIELIKHELHSAGKNAEVLAMWPAGNVQHMPGGREVDRAIFDYPVEEGCLIPHFANGFRGHGTGKMLFERSTNTAASAMPTTRSTGRTRKKPAHAPDAG